MTIDNTIRRIDPDILERTLAEAARLNRDTMRSIRTRV